MRGPVALSLLVQTLDRTKTFDSGLYRATRLSGKWQIGVHSNFGTVTRLRRQDSKPVDQSTLHRHMGYWESRNW